MTDRALYLLDLFYRETISKEELIELKQYVPADELEKLKNTGQQIQRVTAAQEADEFRAKLKQLDQNEDPSLPRRRKYLIPVLVAILLLLATIFWVYTTTQSNQIDETELFLAYAKPYQNIYMPKQRDVSAPTTPLSRAMASYDKKQYKEARTFFSEAENSSADEGMQFYHAVTLFMLGDYQESISLFNRLASSEKYSVPSKWYLLLTSLKQGRLSEVKKYGELLRKQKEYPVIAKETKEVLNKLRL